MIHKLPFIVAAASLVLMGGAGRAQDGKDCRNKNDYPSISGRWRDNENGLEVVIGGTGADKQQNTEGKTVPATANYVSPQTCKRPREDGSIVSIPYDFQGVFTPPTLTGTIAVCYFKSDKDHPSGITTSLDEPDLRLTMSQDGITLSGSFQSALGTQKISYTRLSKPHYYFKQWTTVSIPGGTKIYNKPEPGSEVNLTVSEKTDFQIYSTMFNKDGDPTWYQVTRAGHPIGSGIGWVQADQIKCKKAPSSDVGRIGPGWHGGSSTSEETLN